MNIAFCCDLTALAGLHVSIASLLTALLREDPQMPVNLYIFYEGLTELDCEGVRQTASIHPQVTVTLKPFSTASIRNFRSLHGNYMTYARLFLADLLPSINRVIYLDSDLYISCSLAPLWKLDLFPHLLGAILKGNMKWALEHRFFSELGFTPEEPYFNAGVLMINLDQWRTGNVTQRCITFLETHRQKCWSADQTVLNALFSREHTKLPERYNIPVYPTAPSLAKNIQPGIHHFVGAPKPWDFLGKQLHGNGRFFHQMLACTAFAKFSQPKVNFSLLRVLRLSRSYGRLIKAQISCLFARRGT